MKGDFTRRTFRPEHHYRGVLMQQGRVQLDADWNEQLEIQDHLDRTTTRDTVGTHGGPAGAAGMEIVCAGRDIATGGCATGELRITAGRYYVDGILCENEHRVPLAAQPDLPGEPLPTAPGRYVAYLDVWDEHVTAVERPALREVALGGPDTGTRRRTVWQVRLESTDATRCSDLGPDWNPHPPSTATLAARAEGAAVDADPCVVPTTAGYRRLENQLYRVEIHDGGAAPTFVWSRENGSVTASLVTVAGKTLTIGAPGRDERLGFTKNDWVEIVDPGATRRGEPGVLGRLDEANGTELVVGEWRAGDEPPRDGRRDGWLVRRWDSEQAPAVTYGDWIDLEGGVQVMFGPGTLRTGDYWLIPARSATLTGENVDPDLAGNVEWPRDGNGPILRRPVGIRHRCAPLALLERVGFGRGHWRRIADCRNVFPPLTRVLDMGYAGGDGQQTVPGDELPQPLEVSVSDATGPVAGATVSFAVDDADGLLAPGAGGQAGVATLPVRTGGDGLARAFWRPSRAGTPSQRVTARLLGSAAPPVHFSAQLSTADRVWFDPGGCAALAGTSSVQGALDRLVAARSLVDVGGNGQAGPPGEALPLSAEVLVRSDCGPVPGATVRFTVGSGAVGAVGDDLAAAPLTVDLTTGGDGLARCSWRLGPDAAVQALVAELVDGGAPVAHPSRLAFTATLERGSDVAPGIHVTGVELPTSTALHYDAFVAATDLVEGVAVVLDRAPLRETVDDRPVLQVVLDIPYPFSESDRDLWGQPVFGTMPVPLAGDVRLNSTTVTWTPTADSVTLLGRLFERMAEFDRGKVVTGHLTLTGRAVCDRDGMVVNGLAVVQPGDDGPELRLPSVDDVHGADFTQWFRLVESVVNLQVLRTQAGRLSRRPTWDGLVRAVPGDALRAALPPGARIEPGRRDPDLAVARRTADRDLAGGERQLVVLADQRYADAAEVVRAALESVEVGLEVITSADPPADVRRRYDANEQLDAVLTDDDGAQAVTDVGGFGMAIGL